MDYIKALLSKRETTRATDSRRGSSDIGERCGCRDLESNEEGDESPGDRY